MRVHDQDLYFVRPECRALKDILLEYVPAMELEVMPTEYETLKGYFDTAYHVGMAGIALDFMLARNDGNGAYYQDATEERCLQAAERLVGFYERVNVTQVAHVLNGGELVFKEGRERLTKAFLWAGTHFVEGSVVMQNTTGKILNSDTEDQYLNRAFHLTNVKAANGVRKSYLRYGAVARQWYAQLTGQNN